MAVVVEIDVVVTTTVVVVDVVAAVDADVVAVDTVDTVDAAAALDGRIVVVVAELDELDEVEPDKVLVAIESGVSDPASGSMVTNTSPAHPTQQRDR